jgi:hypothetical protein
MAMDKRVALISGMGLGAGLMFLLDPSLGRRRRHRIGDKARSWAGEAEALLRHEPVDDVTLLEHVRAALGRASAHSGAVAVALHDGSVVLTGVVPAAEMDPIIQTVASVRGVRDLDCRLSAPEVSAFPETPEHEPPAGF